VFDEITVQDDARMRRWTSKRGRGPACQLLVRRTAQQGNAD